ncbi:MAG: BolA family transcriptional regulator [Gemmataceae bacterium]|nr:BolA family transcriptional regulator [Gemmataceae bacterium]
MADWKKNRTNETDAVEAALRDGFPQYAKKHPPAAYRYNPSSIRIRLVSDVFEGLSQSERERLVLPLLRTLPETVQEDVTLLLLLTPREMTSSMINQEFVAPSPPLGIHS